MPTGGRQAHRALDTLLLILCLAALGIAVLYPTLRLVVRALADWDWRAVVQGVGLQSILNTFWISLASVAGAGIVGTGMALLLGRYDFPGRRLLSALAYLPFTLPPLVGVVAFYYIIGRDGFLPQLLERVTGVPGLYPEGPLAILIIHTYSFYVFFYAMVGAALAGMDVSQIEAARTLGAGPGRVFVQIVVPMLKPALLGASLLTFMSSGASFSAPLIFGNDFPMLSVRIYEATTQFQEREALTLTVVLALLSMLGVLLFRSRAGAAGVASKGVRVRLRSRSGRVLAGVAASAAMAVLLAPHAAILFLSFVDHRLWFDQLVPTDFTLANYAGIFHDPQEFAPIRNSAWMSAVAAVATLLVGLPAGYLIGRRRPGGPWVNVLVMIPWALPGTVIAMNLLVAFNDAWVDRLFPRDAILWLLPVGYFVRSIPLLTRMATASIEPFDATLVEAGRTLGMPLWGCFLRIVAPLVAPALVAATALVFATSLGEFVASILLYRPDNIPIAVMINMQLRGSGIGSAFAYSVFLMVLVTLTFMGVRRFSSRLV